MKIGMLTVTGKTAQHVLELCGQPKDAADPVVVVGWVHSQDEDKVMVSFGSSMPVDTTRMYKAPRNDIQRMFMIEEDHEDQGNP